MALIPVVGRKQAHLRFSYWLIVVVLCLGILFHLFNIYFMLITTMKNGFETLQNPPSFWPQNPSLNAWRLAFIILNNEAIDNTGQTSATVPFLGYLWNSLFIVGVTLLLSTPITSFAAYACSKLLRGPKARWLFFFFIGTMLLPGVVSLVPSYLLIQHFPWPFANIPSDDNGNPWPYLQLFDQPWAIIIPGVFNAGGFLFFKAFFDTIPDSVLQAARVDGGSEFNIFRRIVLPMSIPVYSIVMSGQFNGVWDSFLWPSMVIQDPGKLPISVAIYKIVNAFTAQGATTASQAHAQNSIAAQYVNQGMTWNGMLVLGVLQSIPVFIVFVISFKYLLSGVRIRGLK